MRPRFCACACKGVRWARWACLLTRREPANGFRWICSLAMMDCRKRCGCRNKRSWGAGRSRCASLGKGHADGSSRLLGEVEASGWGRPEGTGRAGRSVDRAVEKGAGRDCDSKEFATVWERRGEGIMNRRVCISMVLGGIFMLSAGLAKAQEAAPLPPPPPMASLQVPGPEAGMIGERIELLGFEGMHGGKVVTGVPFSAVAVSESTQTLADGNRISRKTQTNLFRDSQGRFRKEVTLPAIGPLATSGEPKSFVFINDPVANANFILHPDTKTAEQMGKRFGEMKGAMKDAIKGKMEHWKQREITDSNLKQEDLGTQTIAGVSAQGTRFTRTIPAGQIGNEKPITIVHESWYSNDLQIMVMSKRSDPRFGETTYTLTSMQRHEPDASLFSVPPDYTVSEGRPGRHGNVIFKQGPPPPPPAD